MDKKPTKRKVWWKRKEIFGTALTLISSGLTLFASSHTIGYKVGVLIGLGLTGLGLKKGYKANNLPSGITKMIDKGLRKNK